MTAPVLILTFNRPDFFDDLLQKVEQANPAKIYVALDGPRDGNHHDHKSYGEIQRIIDRYRGEVPLVSLIRESNLGCKNAVSTAIDWFFSHETHGIILEDDCDPDLTFFGFCSQMLADYQSEPKVLSIGGYRANARPEPSDQIVFSRYPQIWGWATWRRVWDNYDVEMTAWSNFRDSSTEMRKISKNPVVRRYWTSKFDQVASGEIDTWDYQLTFYSLSQSGLHVLPPLNLIRNRGFDNRATNVGPRGPRGVNFKVGSLRGQPSFRSPQWDKSYDEWLEKSSYRMLRSVLFGPTRRLFSRLLKARSRPVQKHSKGNQDANSEAIQNV